MIGGRHIDSLLGGATGVEGDRGPDGEVGREEPLPEGSLNSGLLLCFKLDALVSNSCKLLTATSNFSLVFLLSVLARELLNCSTTLACCSTISSKVCT